MTATSKPDKEKKATVQKLGAKKARSKKTPKLGRQEWIDAAFRTLIEKGITSIHVETLAKRLGVTKGSFYWHFKDRNELLESVLVKWQEQFVIGRVKSIGGSADEMLTNLLNVVPRQKGSYQRGGSLELAMRSWARADEKAMSTVEAVDRYRVDFVAYLLEKRGHIGAEKEARAFLIYAYLMCQGIFSFDREDDILENIHEDVMKILMQPAPKKEDGV